MNPFRYKFLKLPRGSFNKRKMARRNFGLLAKELSRALYREMQRPGFMRLFFNPILLKERERIRETVPQHMWALAFGYSYRKWRRDANKGKRTRLTKQEVRKQSHRDISPRRSSVWSFA